MKFKRLQELNGAVIERLRVVMDDDVKLLVDQVALGIVELWECDDGDAYMLTRIEPRDLVVCCYEGKNAKHAVPHLIAAAKAKGLPHVRFHTKRPALSRLIKDYKPEISEYVYRIPANEN